MCKSVMKRKNMKRQSKIGYKHFKLLENGLQCNPSVVVIKNMLLQSRKNTAGVTNEISKCLNINQI